MTKLIVSLELSDGMIISNPASIPWYKSQTQDKIFICPGIRPEGFEKNNHFSPHTPRQAKLYGADYIIVGRPIYHSNNPIQVVKSILSELRE